MPSQTLIAKITALIGSVLLIATALPVAAGSQDFTAWNEILQRSVKAQSKGGIQYQGFDYRGLRTDRRAFDAQLAGLARFDPGTLGGKKEKLAFWINAYNLAMVGKVLDNPGVESVLKIKGDPPVFKAVAIQIGGKQYSLDQIEHQILRKLGEPRIHFAIVCASVSCPDLRPEAYTAAKLVGQLDDQARKFLANPSKGLTLDPAARKLTVSKIFEWFGEDFGGPVGFRRFIQQTRSKDAKIPADLAGFQIDYFPYNWKLNDSRR